MVDLTGAAYQGLTDTTVTFHWYAGGEGSGDIDFDTVVVSGEVGDAAANPPTVINSGAADIAPNSATLGGEVTDTGGADPSVTLYWGDNDGGTTPGTGTTRSTWAAQGGAFSAGVTGLTPADHLLLPLLRQQRRRRRLGELDRQLHHRRPHRTRRPS